MKRQSWSNSLIIGIVFFVFSWPAAFITGIMGTAPEMALLSALLFLFGPLFGFIMLIVGIIQLIAKKGEK